jgi:hypothetical protein
MYMCVRNIDVVCSLWVVMYMSVRNIDVVSVPCECSCICLSGISMLSLFLVSCLHIHDHATRNRDNIDIPDRHIHDHSQGTETTSIFLTDIYMTTHKEQRQHRYSWHTYTWPLTRNRDYIDIPMSVRNIDVVSVPCEWSCICLSGISMLSLFLVAWSCICVSGISMLSLFLVSGHVYVCQEYWCCLCSLSVVMYIYVSGI